MSSGGAASMGAVTTGTRRWAVAIGHRLLGRYGPVWAACTGKTKGKEKRMEWA
jgi:hypothetical protein